ncbi:MAG: ester cyclase [SAR202 cluster bacterium]|nr:ester cyclase [SAR202 cluster bacterium]
MSEQNIAIARRFLEGQDKQKGPPPPELAAPNYTAHIGGMPVMNLEAHKQLAVAFYTAFPDLKHNFDEFLAQDNRVAVRFHLTGTHKADLMGIPASNKPISVKFIGIMHISKGKVVELFETFDQMELLQQIGAAPGH